jgi:aminopeptidase N
MQTLVGRDGFTRGMTLYFQRHDGQAVTCDDFAQAIADANPGSALSTRLDAFKRWYAQAGTPRLRARGEYDAEARRYTLTLTQRAAATPSQPDAQPFVIPVLAALFGRDGRPLAAERLLVLDSTEQDFVFDGVDADPVPSLLRGYSAPVVLDDGLGDTELLAMLAHDSDPFNRWEAGQRLALTRLIARLEQPAPLDDAFIAAMRSVLRDDQLEPAFKAMALDLPDELYVAEQLTQVDPQKVHAARCRMQQALAAALHDDWAWAFQTHAVREGYAPTPQQAGRRALANLALTMLCLHAVHEGDPVWPGRAYQRVKEAGNMTDRIGALNALLHSHSALAESALAFFHAAAGGEALVIDKWFALQAIASEPLGAEAGRSFTRAKALLKHPDFSLKNPNRARSLLTALCRNNPAAFHRSDAAGYVLWAEKLLELDAINPQLAARLARVMDRWSVLAEPYRGAAHEAISRVAAKPDLSDDVREVIDRALGASA